MDLDSIRHRVKDGSWGQHQLNGISPRIYPDLLLDHVVQLNIGDLSNKLPPLTEHVMVG